MTDWKMTVEKKPENADTSSKAFIARYDTCSNTKLQFLHAVSPISHSFGVHSATFRAETTSNDNDVNGDQQQQQQTESTSSSSEAADATLTQSSTFCDVDVCLVAPPRDDVVLVRAVCRH